METDLLKEYELARKSGTKARNINRSKGLSLHLKSLDDIIANEPIISEVSLGLKHIRLKKIVGTLTHSRALSFGPNFMPLMNKTTEFSMKWRVVLNHQINDGIRDAVIVYEYLNKYYAVEGNKRISVLKYLDAYSIPAHVTRYLPRYDENNHEIVVYYAFLEFNNKANIDYIWMSQPDNFNKLYNWLVKYDLVSENAENSEDVENDIRYFYNDFRDIYHSLGGDKINITTGDAFLEYLDLYAYHADYTRESLRNNMKKMWNEFSLLTNQNYIEVETTSEQLEKKNIFTNLVGINNYNKKLKVAFVNIKTPTESRWTYSHELGRHHIQNVFGDNIETVAINNVPEDETAYDHLKELSADNYDIIFTTAPTFIRHTLKAAIEYNNIKFLNCSENMSYKNIRTYFGRIYEPNFLVGMVAGSLTTTNKLAYIATYPVPEVINCINAFTLGARFVNPKATVQVKWVESIKKESSDIITKLDQQLASLGIDIVLHEESSDYHSIQKYKGIYFINPDDTDEKKGALAAPIWHWGVFYEKLINNIVSGSYTKISGVLGLNDKAINYWWGMKEGVVDILYSNKNIPLELMKSIEFMKKMIITNEYKIFSGPIYTNKDELKVEEGEALNSMEILKTDWLVDGVLGSIPSINTSKHHPLFEIINVKKR